MSRAQRLALIKKADYKKFEAHLKALRKEAKIEAAKKPKDKMPYYKQLYKKMKAHFTRVHNASIR